MENDYYIMEWKNTIRCMNSEELISVILLAEAERISRGLEYPFKEDP